MTESSAVLQSISNNQLPPDFWSLPEFANGAVELQDIHTALTMRLQAESPDADVLEIMMMERVCFLYVFMRAHESGEGFEFDRSYKEMMQTWVAMAADLRKTKMRAEETSSIRMQIISQITKALKETLVGVDPAVANKIKTQLVTLVA